VCEFGRGLSIPLKGSEESLEVVGVKFFEKTDFSGFTI